MNNEKLSSAEKEKIRNSVIDIKNKILRDRKSMRRLSVNNGNNINFVNIDLNEVNFKRTHSPLVDLSEDTVSWERIKDWDPKKPSSSAKYGLKMFQEKGLVPMGGLIHARKVEDRLSDEENQKSLFTGSYAASLRRSDGVREVRVVPTANPDGGKLEGCVFAVLNKLAGLCGI